MAVGGATRLGRRGWPSVANLRVSATAGAGRRWIRCATTVRCTARRCGSIGRRYGKSRRFTRSSGDSVSTTRTRPKAPIAGRSRWAPRHFPRLPAVWALRAGEPPLPSGITAHRLRPHHQSEPHRHTKFLTQNRANPLLGGLIQRHGKSARSYAGEVTRSGRFSGIHTPYCRVFFVTPPQPDGESAQGAAAVRQNLRARTRPPAPLPPFPHPDRVPFVCRVSQRHFCLSVRQNLSLAQA